MAQEPRTTEEPKLVWEEQLNGGELAQGWAFGEELYTRILASDGTVTWIGPDGATWQEEDTRAAPESQERSSE